MWWDKILAPPPQTALAHFSHFNKTKVKIVILSCMQSLLHGLAFENAYREYTLSVCMNILKGAKNTKIFRHTYTFIQIYNLAFHFKIEKTYCIS